MFPVEPIIDKASHRRALARIEQLWSAPDGSHEARELDVLATLVDAYERRASPIRDLDPISTIEARREELGWTRRDLEPLIGSRARVSEVLGGRRPLTLAMIRRISAAMGIPGEVLIEEPRTSVPAKRRSRSLRRPGARRAA